MIGHGLKQHTRIRILSTNCLLFLQQVKNKFKLLFSKISYVFTFFFQTHYNYDWRDAFRDLTWFPLQHLLMALLLLVHLLITFLVHDPSCPRWVIYFQKFIIFIELELCIKLWRVCLVSTSFNIEPSEILCLTLKMMMTSIMIFMIIWCDWLVDVDGDDLRALCYLGYDIAVRDLLEWFLY